MRDFKQSQTVVSSVAMHKPKPFYGLFRVWRKSEFHEIREAKTQYLGKKLRGFTEVRRRENHVAQSLVSGHKTGDALRGVECFEV